MIKRYDIEHIADQGAPIDWHPEADTEGDSLKRDEARARMGHAAFVEATMVLVEAVRKTNDFIEKSEPHECHQNKAEACLLCDAWAAVDDALAAHHKLSAEKAERERDGRNETMIEVYLTLNDTYVSFNYDEKYGHVHCDTTNPIAALAKAFQYCIEAITEPHDTIVVHHEDHREEE